MAYHSKTKVSIKAASASLGTRLGKLCVKRGFSVQDVAIATGASRTTIYSWFAGSGVSNAYKRTVENLIKTLQTK